MKRKDITVIFDALFAFFVFYLIAICVLRYFRFPYALSFIVGFLIAFALACVVYYLLFLFREKKYLKKRDEEEKSKLMLHLALSKEEEVATLFYSLFQGEYRREGNNLVNEEKRILLKFTLQPVSADEIAEKVKKYPNTKIVVYCNKLSAEAKELCALLHISAQTSSDCYLKLKNSDLLPKTYICGERTKRTMKDKVKVYFSKTNFRPMLFCGGGLLFFSLFTLFPLYYIISGSILVLLSLTVKIFGYSSD